MRTLLLLPVTLFFVASLQAQLAGTTWSIQDGGEELFDIHFGTDGTMYSISTAGEISIGTYTVDGDQFTLTEFNPFDCPPTGIYSFVITEDMLQFTLVDDICEYRIELFLDLDWIQTVSTSISTHGASIGFEAYPNPSNGILNLEQATANGMHVRIYDLSGSLVHEARVTGVREAIDLGHLPKGGYVLQGWNAEGSHSRKLILE
jgi:hypothetical protein